MCRARPARLLSSSSAFRPYWPSRRAISSRACAALQRDPDRAEGHAPSCPQGARERLRVQRGHEGCARWVLFAMDGDVRDDHVLAQGRGLAHRVAPSLEQRWVEDGEGLSHEELHVAAWDHPEVEQLVAESQFSDPPEDVGRIQGRAKVRGHPRHDDHHALAAVPQDSDRLQDQHMVLVSPKVVGQVKEPFRKPVGGDNFLRIGLVRCRREGARRLQHDALGGMRRRESSQIVPYGRARDDDPIRDREAAAEGSRASLPFALTEVVGQMNVLQIGDPRHRPDAAEPVRQRVPEHEPDADGRKLAIRRWVDGEQPAAPSSQTRFGASGVAAGGSG